MRSLVRPSWSLCLSHFAVTDSCGLSRVKLDVKARLLAAQEGAGRVGRHGVISTKVDRSRRTPMVAEPAASVDDYDVDAFLNSL